LRELADELHRTLRDADVTELTEAMYAELPEPVVVPATAYEQLISGTVEPVGVGGLAGRVSAAMIVPYPPGIPVVMPGERFGAADSGLVRYLTACEDIDAHFPGFETEIHGVEIQRDGSYRIPCLSSQGD
jgi:arginine/lysine/ornithine decarboxylase